MFWERKFHLIAALYMVDLDIYMCVCACGGIHVMVILDIFGILLVVFGSHLILLLHYT